ncbi:MAG: gamma-glutamyl-gamma-aminobutyrate hydrolase family protein [Dehalococcoidia bacterium]
MDKASPPIAVTSHTERNARQYIEAVEPLGAQVRLLTPRKGPPAPALLDGVGGLMLTGGPDIHPSYYGEVPVPEAELELAPALDELDFALLRLALERDMPVLAICRGMQVLNVAMGGRLIQDLAGHKPERRDGRWLSAYHSIYLAPGSRLAAVLGSGGFVKVNSQHHQGLREAQRAPGLLTSAYALEDGLVEGIESPQHTWVIGVQCHPERQEELPKAFQRLFTALVERAGEFVR